MLKKTTDVDDGKSHRKKKTRKKYITFRHVTYLTYSCIENYIVVFRPLVWPSFSHAVEKKKFDLNTLCFMNNIISTP